MGNAFFIQIFDIILNFNFRVSPSDENAEHSSRDKRERTGTMIRGDSGSSPDPLEPWSTKDLANINQILGT